MFLYLKRNDINIYQILICDINLCREIILGLILVELRRSYNGSTRLRNKYLNIK